MAFAFEVSFAVGLPASSSSASGSGAPTTASACSSVAPPFAVRYLFSVSPSRVSAPQRLSRRLASSKPGGRPSAATTRLTAVASALRVALLAPLCSRLQPSSFRLSASSSVTVPELDSASSVRAGLIGPFPTARGARHRASGLRRL